MRRIREGWAQIPLRMIRLNENENIDRDLRREARKKYERVEERGTEQAKSLSNFEEAIWWLMGSPTPT